MYLQSLNYYLHDTFTYILPMLYQVFLEKVRVISLLFPLMVYNIKPYGNPTRFIICITDLKEQEKSHSIAWSSMVLHRVVMMKKSHVLKEMVYCCILLLNITEYVDTYTLIYSFLLYPIQTTLNYHHLD